MHNFTPHQVWGAKLVPISVGKSWLVAATAGKVAHCIWQARSLHGVNGALKHPPAMLCSIFLYKDFFPFPSHNGKLWMIPPVGSPLWPAQSCPESEFVQHLVYAFILHYGKCLQCGTGAECFFRVPNEQSFAVLARFFNMNSKHAVWSSRVEF